VLAPRVQSIYGRRKDLNYWHPEEAELANEADARDWTQQERAIDREKREIIQELVGVDLVRERLKQKGEEDYYERRLSFLPEEKRGEVRKVLEHFDELEQNIRSKEWDESLTPSDQAELRRLQQERQIHLANILAPAEREQFELWLSPVASGVRHDVYGMDATEEEFLAIFRLRKNFEENWTGRDLELMDPGSRATYAKEKDELETRLRQELGPERYAQYKRGQDEDFHHLNATVTRFKLPRKTAAEIYGYKQGLQDMRVSVTADATLTPEQKTEALRAMAQETERSVKTLLGEKAFQYYLRRGQGTWIQTP
jgi:hypothetical protein